MDSKSCFICKEVKPVSEFHKRSPTTYNSNCKSCRKEIRKRQWAANNTPKLIEDLPGEEWRPIDWFVYKKYAVSNFSRIKALPTEFDRYEYLRKPTKQDRDPYPYVKMFNPKAGKDIAKSIHQIVAIAFIPNPENKPEVNHKDGDKTNYQLSNLEWVTKSENRIHALTILKVKVSRGEEHYNSKISSDDAIIISKFKGLSKEIQKVYPQLSIGQINSIRRGCAWNMETGLVDNTKKVDKKKYKEDVTFIFNLPTISRRFCRENRIPWNRAMNIRKGKTGASITGKTYVKTENYKNQYSTL